MTTKANKGLDWILVAPTVAGDTARWYLEARAEGMKVVHPTDRPDGVDFDSASGQRGVFREVGWVQWCKVCRRWSVVARANDGAVELSSLIAFGLDLAHLHGTSPGHGLRSRDWTHDTFDNGHRRAWAEVCIQLGVEDLMASSTSQAIDWSVLEPQLLAGLQAFGEPLEHSAGR